MNYCFAFFLSKTTNVTPSIVNINAYAQPITAYEIHPSHAWKCLKFLLSCSGGQGTLARIFHETVEQETKILLVDLTGSAYLRGRGCISKL